VDRLSLGVSSKEEEEKKNSRVAYSDPSSAFDFRRA
jgi:hypothetical protein